MTATNPLGIRLEKKVALPEAIERASEQLDVPFCDVMGFGELEWLELAGPEEGSVLRFEGPLQLLDLKGRIRRAGNLALDDFVCIVSRHTDNGIQLLGGRFIRAQAAFVELIFTPLVAPGEEKVASVVTRVSEIAAPAVLVSPAPPEEPEAPVGEAEEIEVPPPIVEIAPPPRATKARSFAERAAALEAAVASVPDLPLPPKASAPIVESRWADAIAESERVQKAAAEGEFDDDDDARPLRGDIVMHRQFGRCTVAKIDDDHIALRKPDGRNVQLGLLILQFKRIGKEGKHSVFDVEVRPRY